MNPDRSIGSARPTSLYRHPLLVRISGFLSSIQSMPDPVAQRRVRWTRLATWLVAILMALDPGCPLAVRCGDALACVAIDFNRRRRVGKTYNGWIKALEPQAPVVGPALKVDLRRQAHAHLERIPRTAG